MPMSWDEIRSRVREFRIASSFHVPTMKDFTFDISNNQFYFLGSISIARSSISKDSGASNKPIYGKVMTIFSASLPNLARESIHSEDDLMQGLNLDGGGVTQLISEEWLRKHSGNEHDTLSREEVLLKERKRISTQGIMGFQLFQHNSRAHIFFTYNHQFYVGQCPQNESETFNPQLLSKSNFVVSLDPKVGGMSGTLISFVRENNLYVMSLNGNELQLTNTGSSTFSNGLSEFIMQEEFRRFTGYWWAPAVTTAAFKPSRDYILYLEVDESPVEIVSIARPRLDDEVETYRYPRVGRPNAKSEPCVASFSMDLGDVEIHRLPQELSVDVLFPWVEYIARLGWTPCGNWIWMLFLNRAQTRSSLVIYPIASFLDHSNLNSSPQVFVLWEETSDFWINVTDAIYFLDMNDPNTIELVLASERTGYRHLYQVHCNLYFDFKSSLIGQTNKTIRQVTNGPWQVVDSPIWVDEAESFVYFSGKRETPLETHFYVASISPESTVQLGADTGELNKLNSNIHLLTRPGLSHIVKMDPSMSTFISLASSTEQSPCIMLHSISDCIHISRTSSPLKLTQSTSHRSHGRFASKDSFSNNSNFEQSPERDIRKSLPITYHFQAEYEEWQTPIPEFFSFYNFDGVEIFGLFYKPQNYVEGRTYPTILRIYGGPNVQVVTNDYKHPKFQRVFLALKFGFVVVMIDSRGSYDRGVEFEGHIKHRLGTVELVDQIEGLIYLATRSRCSSRHIRDTVQQHINSSFVEYAQDGDVPEWNITRSWEYLQRCASVGVSTGFVDPFNVSINGWSYGGYLSLIALAQYPQVFRVAISGAPVTCWELYDTAYTERYMGLLEENPKGYKEGSVLEMVESFPDKENRLLIVHGSIDENVHFKNTEMLVSALVRASKPHRVQVYPGERHGLKAPNVVEHFETLMMWTLVNSVMI